MGMPLICGRAKPFIVSPIAYPPDYLASITGGPDLDAAPKKTQQHVIQIALKWKQMLDTESGLTRAQLARNQRVSRARVTQIMSLLRLAPCIQTTLRHLSDANEMRFLSERKLRPITRMRDHGTQVSAFDRLIQSRGHGEEPTRLSRHLSP